MKKSGIAIIGIIILSFVLAIYLYPQMPNWMASHWNAKGEVNGYISKFWGLFLMPIISALLFLLFTTIPKIDPLKENIEKFRKYFDWFIVVIMTFLFYLYLLTIIWNLGFRFNFSQFFLPIFGLLFYYTGILVEHAKRNWFIGIRTPWTLSNEKVWDKTHRLGGKLFKITGVMAFLGIIFPSGAVFFVLVPTLFTSFFLVIYSYLEYQKEINPPTRP